MISQAKTGLSALALKRQLEVSHPTSWLIHHKLMHAMQQRDNPYLLGGLVQIDAAYLGGEPSGGKAGRGSENKVPFVAAVEFNQKRRPIRIRISRVSGFTTRAISSWAQNHVAAGTTVITDGLACFAGVTEAGCKHIAKIAGSRKPKELPLLQWLNTIPGNVKTGPGGAYHAFLFSKYSNRYLAEIAYRFNRRFNLKTLHQRLLIAAVSCPEAAWPFPGVDPGKDSNKKDAVEPPDLLCTHNQKCHGDRGLCTFGQPRHNQLLRILSLP